VRSTSTACTSRGGSYAWGWACSAVKVFARSYTPGSVLAIHLQSGSSVRGAFVRRTRRHWVLTRHAVEADGVFVESAMDRLLVPVENVALVEVRDR
jgi:hypothetical protein